MGLIIIISLCPLNVLMDIGFGFQSVNPLHWLLCKFSPSPLSSPLVVTEFGEKPEFAGSSILQTLQKEVGSRRSMNAPLYWVERFVQGGQCVAFMGDSSLDSSGPTWEKQNGAQSHVCPEGVGGCSMGAGGGRQGVFLPGPKSQLY